MPKQNPMYCQGYHATDGKAGPCEKWCGLEGCLEPRETCYIYECCNHYCPEHGCHIPESEGACSCKEISDAEQGS